MDKEALITKNEGNHPFDIGRRLELGGCCWIEETGNLSTPDGRVPNTNWISCWERP